MFLLLMTSNFTIFDFISSNLKESVTVENKASNCVTSKYKLQFDVNELNSVRRVYPGYGIPSIIFMLSDGHTWPALYFHKGGSKEFLQELKAYFVFTKYNNSQK